MQDIICKVHFISQLATAYIKSVSPIRRKLQWVQSHKIKGATLRKTSYNLVILTLDYYISISYWGKPLKFRGLFVTAVRFALTDPKMNNLHLSLHSLVRPAPSGSSCFPTALTLIEQPSLGVI